MCLFVFRVVLETDPNVIAGKVAMQSTEASGSLSEQVMTITSSLNSLLVYFWISFVFVLANLKFFLQTLTQALATAREHLARSLLTWVSSFALHAHFQLLWRVPLMGFVSRFYNNLVINDVCKCWNIFEDRILQYEDLFLYLKIFSLLLISAISQPNIFDHTYF